MIARSLVIVTGAPASGKSSTVAELLRIQSEFVVLDIDWLADSASDLAGKSIYSEPSTWVPYGKLWFEFLHAIYKNSKRAIFFTPNTPADFDLQGIPDWIENIHWLLLDCEDSVRQDRLDARLDWSMQRKLEAIQDGQELRDLRLSTIDTEKLQPVEVAKRVLAFASQHD